MKTLSLRTKILLVVLLLLVAAIIIRQGVRIYVRHDIEENIDDFQY